MVRRASLVAVVVACLTLVTPLAASASSIEAEVFAKINAGRGGSFVHHSGLHSVAYEHSQGMAQRGGLDHNGADSRISNAPPDPGESNGAPDDGVPPAAWCENVTYVMYVSESEVADRIYAQWKGSGAHGRCMTDTSRNVAAVGVYYDGEAWWATFIANVDKTPPGGARAPAEAPPPKRETKPNPTAPPRAAETMPAEVPANEPVMAVVPAAEVPAAAEQSLTTVIRFDPPASDEPTKLRPPAAAESDTSANNVRFEAMAPPVGSRAGAVRMPPWWQMAATGVAAALLASRVVRRRDRWPAASDSPIWPPPSTPLAFTEERSSTRAPTRAGR